MTRAICPECLRDYEAPALYFTRAQIEHMLKLFDHYKDADGEITVKFDEFGQDGPGNYVYNHYDPEDGATLL